MNKIMRIFICILMMPIDIMATAMVITSPGEYHVEHDVVLNASLGDTIILIKSSDVVLDLGSHIITQKGLALNVTGITIASNVSNVIIKNGCIKNVTGIGITLQAGCSHIQCEELIFDGCGQQAIVGLGTALTPLYDIQISTCDFRKCAQTANKVLDLQFCNAYIGNQLIFTKNGAVTHDLCVVQLTNCTNSELNDLRIYDSSGLNSVCACLFSGCAGCRGNSWIIRNNIPAAANGAAIGIELQSGSSQIMFAECVMVDTILAGIGSTVTGFKIDTGISDVMIRECDVVHNSSNADITGFSIVSSTRILLENCHVQRNSAIMGIARGFLLNGSSEIRLIRCSGDEQNSITSLAIGVDMTTSQDCLLQENRALKNTGSSNANCFGFRVSPNAPTGNNVFVKNVAMQNGLTAPVAANQFSGFATNQQNVQTNEAVNSISQPWTNAGFA